MQDLRFNLLLAISVLIILFLPASAAAGAEDAYYDRSIHGSAGWDLDYGYDEELDNNEGKDEINKKEKEKKRVKEDQERKEARQDDFFVKESEVYDKSLSKTEKEKDQKY